MVVKRSRAETLGVDDGSEKKEKEEKKKKKKKKTTPTETPTAETLGASVSAAVDGDDLARTVYCEGLNYECGEDEIRSFFAELGGRVASLRLPRYQDSGKLRGYAHVEFAEAAAAARAVAASGAALRGRYVTIAAARPRGAEGGVAAPAARARPEGCATVFVKNLPYDATADGVRDAFRRCGVVADVRLAVWNHTGRKKGFGYVQFRLPKSAETVGDPRPPFDERVRSRDGTRRELCRCFPKRAPDGRRRALESRPKRTQAVLSQKAIAINGRPVIVDYESAARGADNAEAGRGGRPRASFRAADGRPWAKTAVGRRAKKAHRKEA